MGTFEVRVTFAWWWSWLYVPGVVFMAGLGFTPNWDRIGQVMGRAARVSLVRVRHEVQA